MFSSHEGRDDWEIWVGPAYSMPCAPFLALALVDESRFFSAKHGYHTPDTSDRFRAGHVTHFGQWHIKRSLQRAFLERFPSLIHRESQEEPLFATCSLPSCLRWCPEKTWCLVLRQPHCNHEGSHYPNSKDGRTERCTVCGPSVMSKGDTCQSSAPCDQLRQA